MKDETGNYNNGYKEKEGRERQKGFKNKTTNYEYKTKNKSDKNEKKISNNSLNINQIGELSMYPDAEFIDGLDCE